MDQDHHRMRPGSDRQIEVGALGGVRTVAMGLPARKEIEDQARASHVGSILEGRLRTCPKRCKSERARRAGARRSRRRPCRRRRGRDPRRSPAMSRCAHGVSPTKFARNDGGRDRARLARFRCVVQIAVFACDQLGVLLVQRQAPDDLARARAGRGDVLGEIVVVAHQPRVGRAERDDHRAGERGQVDDPLGAERDGVAQAVGQHEAALGVGVVDLDRLPVRRGDDVPGLDRTSARQVLGGADDRDEPDRVAAGARSRRPPPPRRRRRTCRTSSPPSSPRASARCRRCRTSRPCRRSPAVGPLAGPVVCGPVVSQDDQRGLLLGALRDGGEGAHAEPLRSPRVPPPRPAVPRSRRRVPSAYSASAVGVRSLPGRFCRSRALLTASATVAARAVAASASSPLTGSSAGPRRAAAPDASASTCPRPRALTCAGRSGSRRGSSPPRAPPRSPSIALRVRRRGAIGASQHSRLLASSRARSRATAAATRACSGVKSLRAPSPTVSQRLPSAWVSASALNEPLASPDSTSSPSSAGAPAEGCSLSNRPDDDGVGVCGARRLGGGGYLHGPGTISARRQIRPQARRVHLELRIGLLALPVCSPFPDLRSVPSQCPRP